MNFLDPTCVKNRRAQDAIICFVEPARKASTDTNSDHISRLWCRQNSVRRSYSMRIIYFKCIQKFLTPIEHDTEVP